MVLNSLLPVFALIAMGMAFKRWRLTTTDFLKTADRLVYFIFFPALLFWKIGGAPAVSDVNWLFYLTAALAVLVIYLASLAYIGWRIPDFQAGTFSQSCYRFNTYIGMAIIINALGQEGVRQFGLLIGFLIPLINVLAVSTLTWYAGGRTAGMARIRQALRAMLANPLIIACLTGLVYSRMVGGFPVFIDNTLGLMAAITLPLALLSIGGALTLAGILDYWGPSLIGTLFKLVLLPLTGWALFRWMDITGLELTVGMIFFALPTSPSIYVLSSQLKSDTRLASAAIVASTALSFLSLTIVLTVFG
jgi:predicted permease